MSAPLLWYALAVLAHSSPPTTPAGLALVYSAPPSTPWISQMPQTTVDTTQAAEPPLVPLTADLATRYLAVREDVFAFIQAHPAVITARIPVRVYTLTMRGPGGVIQGHSQVGLLDFAALAAQTPAVAALFTKHRFPPAQFTSVTLTLRKALFAAALHQSQGFAIKDPASVEGKNIAFVEAHAKDYIGSDLATTDLQR